jgi:hypothetical protein
MNWRDPKKQLPENNQLVWIMLEPHKRRGGLLESAPSIEIVCGWANTCNSRARLVCRIENMDELGSGGIGWFLGELPNDFGYNESYGIAWLPVEEMPFPSWLK